MMLQASCSVPLEGIFSNNKPSQHFTFLAYQRYTAECLQHHNFLTFDGKQQPKNIWFRGC